MFKQFLASLKSRKALAIEAFIVVVAFLGATYGGIRLGANVDHSTTTIHGGHSLVVPGDTLGGFMSGTDKTKLDGLGLTMKGTADAWSLVNLTSLTGLAVTVDGVALNTDGMEVCSAAQTTTTQDGCYLVHSGAWTRAPELASGSTATNGYYVVGTGTSNKGVYVLRGGVVGTNDLTATNVSSGGGTPASTITRNGYPEAVGTSTNYAREDHKHQRSRPNAFHAIYEDFDAGTLNGTNNWATIGTGTAGAQVTTDATHIGITEVSTGASATARETLMLTGAGADAGASIRVTSVSAIETEWLVREPLISTVGVQEFITVAGYGDTFLAGGQVNGIFFDHAQTTDTHWRINACSASTCTTTNTTVTVTANQWYRLGWRKAEGSTMITFTIDGTDVGTITTNIPTTGIMPLARIEKSAGTTARVFDFDWFFVEQSFATPRG